MDNIRLLSERQNEVCQQMERDTKEKCEKMVAEAEQRAQQCWDNCSIKIKQLVDSFDGLQQAMDMYTAFQKTKESSGSQIGGTLY